MRVIVCGGGVIGASIAYFLTLRGVEAVVVERAAVAVGASGKSGGFIALDWCDGTPLQALARRSFELHARLADEHGNPWGYRRLDTLAVVASAGRTMVGSGLAGRPGWVGESALVHQHLGGPATTAQIDPARFTNGLIEAAVESGARVRHGTVTGLLRPAGGGRVLGVLVDGEELRGDAVVIAMGPWSAVAAGWLPLPAVDGLKGNSLVFQTGPEISPHALFVQCEAADGTVDQPEVVPRPDGTTYMSGLSSRAPLPADPLEVAPDPGARDKLLAMARTFAPALADAEVLAAQACYRPVTRDGLPLIGPVGGAAGAYVATGHSVWGMLNAPATGEAIAELITEGASTLDLGPFDPARLPALRPVRADVSRSSAPPPRPGPA